MQTRPGWLMTLWERRPLWMTVLFALILVAAAAVANAETRDLRFDPTGLTRVVLDIDAGDVTLGNGDELSLLIDDTEAGDDCEVTVERDGDVLRLHAGSVGRPSRTDCRVDVTVHVPLPLIIEASVGAGDVTLDDLASPARVTLGAGSIDGHASGAPLHVTTGAGDVDLRSLTSAVTAETGAGTVSLSFDEAPDGVIRASAGVGDVTVAMPTDAAVDTELSAGLGTIHQVTPDQPGAATVVRASTGIGTVTVHPG